MKKFNVILIRVLVILSFLLILAHLFYFSTEKNSFDGSWKHTFFPASTLFFSCLLFVVSIFQNRKNNIISWNKYVFEEKCKKMASDLKSGKRSWFLNPVDSVGGEYLAVPLSSNNKNEMGGGVHIDSNKEEVEKLITQGKILNAPTDKTVLKYC